MTRPITRQVHHEPPFTLEGEGLRPNENRDKAANESGLVPGAEGFPATIPGGYPGFIPTRDFPNPPNMPYSPFPYTPFNSDMMN